MIQPVLSLRHLCVAFSQRRGTVIAVNDVSFDIAHGEVLGVVGESGSGKSVTFLTVMGLVDPRSAEVTGSVLFHGEELLRAKGSRLREIRGASIGMIFQDPMTSLNPFLRVSTQLTEVLVKHRGMGKADATRHAVEMLDRVAIPEAAKRIRLLAGRQLAGPGGDLRGEPVLGAAQRHPVQADHYLPGARLEVAGQIAGRRGLRSDHE